MKKRLFYVLSLAIIVLNIVPVAKVYAAETKFEWVNQEGALEEDGDFWTWGYNCGQIEDAGYSGETKKIMRGVKKVIGLGQYNTIALKKNGDVLTWGSWNQWGALGNGSNKSSYKPQKILEQVKDISVDASDDDNFDTGAAIKEDGSLWTWGNNKCGALGNSSEDEYSLKLNNLGLIEPSVRHG